MPKKRNHGDGALYFIKSRNLWRGVVDAGFNLDGSRKQFYVHSRKQKDCRLKLEALKDQIAREGAPTKAVTLSEWYEIWKRQSIQDTDPKTFASNTSAMNAWFIPRIGNVKLRELRPSHIRSVREDMVDAGRAPSTISRTLTVLSKVLNDAIEEKLIEDNPVKPAVRGVKRAKKATRTSLSVEDALAILRAASQHDPALASRFFFKMLSGQRQSEILGATLPDLHLSDDSVSTYQVSWKLEELSWSHGCEETPCGLRWPRMCPTRKLKIPFGFEYVHLEGRWYLTRPKSLEGRTIPLIPLITHALREHLSLEQDALNPHGLIWHNDDGSPIDPKVDAAQWRQLLFEAGIITAEENVPGGTKLTGHVARHTLVTLLAALNVDFQIIGEIVGHSSVSVTTLYRHASMEEKAKAMQMLGETLQLEV